MKKQIISYSLWGTDSKYTIGAIRNAEAALEVYPGWICRFHIGSDVPHIIVQKLEEFENVEIVRRAEPCNWTAMFWRFEDASAPDVEVMISRDTDSRLTKREAAAVSEWLSTSEGFHIMRDHPYHATEILGGMWGSRKGVVPNMKEMIGEYIKGDFWQVDQNFLREKIYPLVKSSYCVHDEFFEKKPFPEAREPGYFVGQAFNADDSLCNPEHTLML